jgi:HAE1 family hydrophobic/amphiphilic exporter-1
MSLLARLSLANRGLVALIAVVVTGFGFIAIPALKQQLLPSLEFPAAFVVAAYPGAAPEVVEEQVVRPIETGVQAVAGLSKVTSTASEGSATLQVEFEFGTDLGDAVNDLQTSLNRVAPELPEGVQPQVFAGSTDDLPVVVLAAAAADGGERTEAEEREFADRLRQVVVPELQAIEGVRQVEVTGARDPVVSIAPDPAKLAAAGLAPTAIGAALRANGVTVPAGGIIEGQRSLTVQAGTPIGSIEDLRGLYLTGATGTIVRLGDVARVEQTLAPATALTRTNGAPSLGVAVTAAPGGNAVDISHEVRDRLADLSTALGGGAQLTPVFDQAPFVEESIESLAVEGLLGLVMAVLVILFFLLSIRSTLVTAVSIPLSVVVALIALWVGGHSLNLLTLGALTIAVGRVVDDSIVVLENIKRHLAYGEAKRRAIIDGVREVAGAVTASTLTTVAVFAPIALVGGFVGELFAPFAITVTVALLASLLVSLTVIPVLAYWFLRPAGDGQAEESVRQAAQDRELRSPLQRGYLPVIGFATRRRVATLLIGVVVLMVTFGLSTRLDTNFIDQSGEDTLTISQELPAGTSLAATDEAARRVEGILRATGSIASYQVTVGQGELFGLGGGGGANSAQFQVTVAEDADPERVQSDLRGRLDAVTDAGELTIGAGQGGGVAADTLQIIVQASQPDVLERAAEQVRVAMAGTPEVADVTTSLAESAPRVDIVVDRAAAARSGLTEAAVAQTVAQAFRGAPLGRVTLDGEQQDVLLSAGQPPTSLEALRALPVPTAAGPVALDNLANVAEVEGPVQVTRIDGSRSVTVTGTAMGSDIGATTEALTARLETLNLPGDASYTVGGVSADQAEAFGDLGLAVLAAIAIVFLIMVATFRSLVQPLILLVSVPFAATGAITLLLLTGTPLGVPALIGVLMLVGIVVTNAIVLLDLINQYRSKGMGVREAVVEGGRRRLRPILMTAIATIFALLPMALGLTGEGGFISQPLAIVVIGGLVSSTLLTLVLVPTLYTMVENAKEWLRRRRGRRGAAPGEAGGGGAADEHVTVRTRPTEAGSPAAPAVVGALREKTDQFEVLRLPRANRSPLHRRDP